MEGQMRFDGKVVLITGAGGGLGREYALAFAERGAKVVVNDLGGDISGGGKSSRAADKVVDEIKAKGGTAVANYNSVEDGEKLVQTALDNFGKIDIVINNAGILRDRSFARTSDQDWDLIHRVHLRGSFMVTRAAWPHMKNNKFGRIVMTTSSAGIYGNFGQANYSAAKLGMLGLSNTLAIEGQKYNIRCNTIAPIAGSRLTATVFPEDMLNALKPEYVMPLVLWLCHEDCPASGELHEVGAGWVGKLRWQRAKGVMLRTKDKVMTPESVRDNWEAITDFSDPQYPSTITESSGYMYQLYLESEAENEVKANATAAQRTIAPQPTSSAIQPDKAIGAEIPSYSFSYTERDVILYALGVGMSTEQHDYLKFLFEYNEDFCTLPTYTVIPVMAAVTNGLTDVEGLSIDMTQILHGEQYLELYKPLPTTATLRAQGRIADVLDKGSGAVILVDVDVYDESNEKIAYNQVSIFVQRAGGFGGQRASRKAIAPISPPKRAPDATIKEKTDIDQAALYRLSGDKNPLHIDPNFAAMGGFSKPILHGLCSFGYAVRHVLKQYADNDVSKFRAVKVRFSKPVLPGETIQTDMWKEGQRVYFECRVAETGATSLSGCYVDLVGDSTLVAQPTAGTISSDVNCETDVLMKIAAGRIASQPALTKQANAIFQFNVLKNKKMVSQWVIDMKSKPATCYRGECTSKPDVAVTMEDSDIIDLITGKLAGPKAFLSGKLKLKGNIMLVQKLGTIFMEKAKL